MDELNRTGANGPVMGIFAGLQYGCPPVKDFANSTLRDAILPSLLNGSKRIALAVTEPQAGSNVANLSASAVKSPDGKHYIVNGTKKSVDFCLFMH